MEKSNNKKAAELGDELIANYPEDWRGYYSRSLVYMNENNSEAIIDLLEPVSEVFNSTFSIQYLIGLAHSRLKQYDLAISYYEKSHLIEPNSTSLLHSMAILYDSIKQIKKAKKYLESSLEISKDNSVVLEHLGDVLMKDNKQKEAINYYKRALALDKNNPILIKKVSLE